MVTRSSEYERVIDAVKVLAETIGLCTTIQIDARRAPSGFSTEFETADVALLMRTSNERPLSRSAARSTPLSDGQ